MQGTLKDTKPKDGHTASLLIMLQIKNKKLNVVKMISVRGSKPKNFSYPTIHNVVHFDVIEEIDNEFKYAPTRNIKRIF